MQQRREGKAGPTGRAYAEGCPTSPIRLTPEAVRLLDTTGRSPSPKVGDGDSPAPQLSSRRRPSGFAAKFASLRCRDAAEGGACDLSIDTRVTERQSTTSQIDGDAAGSGSDTSLSSTKQTGTPTQRRPSFAAMLAKAQPDKFKHLPAVQRELAAAADAVAVVPVPTSRAAGGRTRGTLQARTTEAPPPVVEVAPDLYIGAWHATAPGEEAVPPEAAPPKPPCAGSRPRKMQPRERFATGEPVSGATLPQNTARRKSQTGMLEPVAPPTALDLAIEGHASDMPVLGLRNVSTPMQPDEDSRVTPSSSTSTGTPMAAVRRLVAAGNAALAQRTTTSDNLGQGAAACSGGATELLVVRRHHEASSSRCTTEDMAWHVGSWSARQETSPQSVKSANTVEFGIGSPSARQVTGASSTTASSIATELGLTVHSAHREAPARPPTREFASGQAGKPAAAPQSGRRLSLIGTSGIQPGAGAAPGVAPGAGPPTSPTKPPSTPAAPQPPVPLAAPPPAAMATGRGGRRCSTPAVWTVVQRGGADLAGAARIVPSSTGTNARGVQPAAWYTRSPAAPLGGREEMLGAVRPATALLQDDPEAQKRSGRRRPHQQATVQRVSTTGFGESQLEGMMPVAVHLGS